MTRAPTEMEIAACREACDASPAIGRAVPCLAPNCPCMMDTCLPVVRAVVRSLRDAPHTVLDHARATRLASGDAAVFWNKMIDAISPPEGT